MTHKTENEYYIRMTVSVSEKVKVFADNLADAKELAVSGLSAKLGLPIELSDVEFPEIEEVIHDLPAQRRQANDT